jgi:hypothetical protein
MNKNNTYVATLTALLVITSLMNINPILSLARHSSSASSEKSNNTDNSGGASGGRTGNTGGSSG